MEHNYNRYERTAITRPKSKAMEGEIMNLSVLLQSADGFLQAGKLLYSTHDNGLAFLRTYISPCSVNCAFACELYLKYLYIKEHDGRKAEGHYLTDIFKNLSPDTQNRIKTEYEKWSSILSFEDCLEIHKRTFIDWRYMYEDDKAISVEPQSLYNLMISLHNVCKENRTVE